MKGRVSVLFTIPDLSVPIIHAVLLGRSRGLTAPAAPGAVNGDHPTTVSGFFGVLLRRSRGLTAPAAWAPPAGFLP